MHTSFCNSNSNKPLYLNSVKIKGVLGFWGFGVFLLLCLYNGLLFSCLSFCFLFLINFLLLVVHYNI